jgi:hypothetical protein
MIEIYPFHVAAVAAVRAPNRRIYFRAVSLEIGIKGV